MAEYEDVVGPGGRRGIHAPTNNAKAWRAQQQRLHGLVSKSTGKPKSTKRSRLAERGQMDLGFSVEEMTPVPPSDWEPPDLSQLPDKLYGIVGVDLETNDEGLRRDSGAGWAWRGGGHVAGYSITADNWSGYLPVGHAEGNVDHDQVRRWLNHVLQDDRQTKVFAHAMYDISWAKNDGVEIRGPIRDVQLIEALLDEYRLSYSLENIARDRIGETKQEDLLRAAALAYNLSPKEDIAKLHSKYVGPYAEWDSQAPRRILEVQMPLIERDDLVKVMELEHALLPMYMSMRRRGVRIDVDYVEKLKKKFQGAVDEKIAEMKRRTGLDINIWAAGSIAKAFDAEGLQYGTTKTGLPSITQKLLEDTDHWLAKMIRQAREGSKLVGTFLQGQLLDQLHNGRVHGSIHPLKSDDGGTVTGRLSMSDPNLQFIPTRTEEGKMIRRAFIAEDGEQWGLLDFNQQEVRLLIHFACKMEMQSAYDARDRYISDPGLNYHQFVADLVKLPYKASKIMNFAIIYGRGVYETSIQLNKTKEQTQAMFDQHAREMPFAKEMSKACKDRVNDRGYIRSIMNRRMRFPYWEPRDWDLRDGRMLKWEEAREVWPDEELARARIHKALNSLIQPSAADQMKLAMLALWNEGYGDRVMIQVHDEADCSIPDEAMGRKMADIMIEACPLEVPVKVDVEVGENWADCK